MLNMVVLMGRLVADPELRYTPSNVAVTRFRIAVERSFAQGGERKADFIDIQAWRQTAEFVCKYFRKGSLIAVDGEIRTDTYTDKDGNKRNVFEVQANHVHFTGEKSGSGTMQGAYAQPQRSEYAPPAPQPLPPVQQPAPMFAVGTADEFQEVADSDDLPF